MSGQRYYINPDLYDALLAENERLKEALRAIASNEVWRATEDAFSVQAFRRCQGIARAALAGERAAAA